MNGKSSPRFIADGSAAPGATIKSARELESMRAAGRIVALAMKRVLDAIEPGITTRELDRIAQREIKSHGAKPAFLGYLGFPATVCISLNEEIVHGIPGDRVVQDGDLISMDCGAIVDGMYSDHAVTAIAGAVTPEKQALVDATRISLERGISAVRAGNRIGDISNAIESYVLPLGYELVREYVGHGIGHNLHEPPQVPNFGKPGQGPLLRVGMVLAIEPMVNMGGWETTTLGDQWTVVTADGELSAHFEHTVAITEEGPEILTAHQAA